MHNHRFIGIYFHPIGITPQVKGIKVCLQGKFICRESDRSVDESVISEEQTLGIEGMGDITDE